jgi:hypothetical protein
VCTAGVDTICTVGTKAVKSARCTLAAPIGARGTLALRSTIIACALLRARHSDAPVAALLSRAVLGARGPGAPLATLFAVARLGAVDTRALEATLFSALVFGDGFMSRGQVAGQTTALRAVVANALSTTLQSSAVLSTVRRRTLVQAPVTAAGDGSIGTLRTS